MSFKYFIIFDGLYSSLNFLRNYFFTYNQHNLESKYSLIVSDYQNLYKLNMFNRYIVYLILFLLLNIFHLNEYYLLFVIFFTNPTIINSISLNNSYIECVNMEIIFIRYSFCKIFINMLEFVINTKIQNYHIFILYNVISLQKIYTICYNLVFIHIMNLLRKYYYFYYKALKIIYKSEYKYDFVIINEYTAYNSLLTLVNNKEWNKIDSIETLNSFYTLLNTKFLLNIDFILNLKIKLYKFMTIWTLISLCKLHIIFGTIILLSLLKNKKTIPLYLITLYVFDINDIIITLLFINEQFIERFIIELIFFIKNYKNIKKALLSLKKL